MLYEADVEIWPGQVVLPAGSTVRLRVEGRDFMRPRSCYPRARYPVAERAGARSPQAT